MLQDTAVRASGKTGGICQMTGPYNSERNKSIVVMFSKGDKFTADPVDGRATTWYIIRAS